MTTQITETEIDSKINLVMMSAREGDHKSMKGKENKMNKIIKNENDGIVEGVGKFPIWITSDKVAHMSRYEAELEHCTHERCSVCGEVHSIHSYCDNCRRLNRIKQWNKFERVECTDWELLLLYDGDECFRDSDEIADHCEDHRIEVENLMLVMTEQVIPHKLDVFYWEDCTSDDFSTEDIATPELIKAIEKVNEEVGLCNWGYEPINKVPVIPGFYSGKVKDEWKQKE